jgi:cardiolipin synthase
VSLPNFLTFLRIFLIPTFATAYLYGHPALALAAFLGAGITDALDGWLARRSNQQTEFGSILDPAADKLLMLTSFGLLTYTSLMPLWALIIAVSREVFVVGGWVIRHMVTSSSKVVPSLLGKATTLAQVAAVSALLLGRQGVMPANAATWLLYAAILLTALSGLDYLYRGLKELQPRAVSR